MNVPKNEAEDTIFGYIIINDVSARDLQTRHKQWYFGKSLDGFCPMGPCIVTKDDIAWPPALNISTWVNGELRQRSNTRNKPRELLAVVNSAFGQDGGN